MNITWLQAFFINVVVIALMIAFTMVFGDRFTTWGIYLYVTWTNTVIASLMTVRLTLEHRAARRLNPPRYDVGWTPRNFFFTLGQWGVAFLFAFLAWRISDLPEPPEWFNDFVRVAIGVIATNVLIVLRWWLNVPKVQPAQHNYVEVVMGDAAHEDPDRPVQGPL